MDRINPFNAIYFICSIENKIDFFENAIEKSNFFHEKIKHKIYLELFKLCSLNNINTNKDLKKCITLINPNIAINLNINDFIEFLIDLTHEETNNIIEKIDNKFMITEKDFYSSDSNININLFKLIKENLNLKKENKYLINNIKSLEKIYKNIDDKEILFEYLNNFHKCKKEMAMEKLDVLKYLSEDVYQDDIYDDIIRYYQEMNDALEKLSTYKQSLQIYHFEIKKKEIKQLEIYAEKLKKQTYKGFFIMKLELFCLLDDNYEIIQKINEVKNSKNFQNIYEKEKDSFFIRFDIAYKNFMLFKKKFSIENEEKNTFKNDSQISKKEKIKGDKVILIEQVNEEIILNIQNLENDLSSMFSFFSFFKDNKILYKEFVELSKKFEFIINQKDISEKIKFFLKLIEEKLYFYNDNINEELNYIIFFNLFKEKAQALSFLNEHSIDEVKLLYFKLIHVECSVEINDISNTIECIKFFKELKKINGGMKEVITYIKLKFNEKEFNYFKNYCEVYPEIIRLLYNAFDYYNNIYEEINAIISSSKFNFHKEDEELYAIDKENYITIDSISRLKNITQLKIEEIKNLNENEILDKYNFFYNFSENIIDINNIINTLRKKGSLFPIFLQIEVSYPNIICFLGENNEEKTFKDILKYLHDLKINHIDKLNLIYKEIHHFRFIYGKQIDMMLNHIERNLSLNSFLRYILNITDCNKKINEGIKLINRKTNDYIYNYNEYNNDSFGIIQNYLLSLFKINNLSIKEFYQNILIKKDYNLKGIFKYESQSESMEFDILNIFLDKLEKLPLAQNILNINNETLDEEINAFLNRAILCKYNTLFIIKVDDSISDYQKDYIYNIIGELLAYKNSIFNENNYGKILDINEIYLYMDSCLVFLYNQKNESFFTHFEKFGIKEAYIGDISYFNSSIIQLRKDLLSKTHIIQSDKCGLGKSTKIKKEIKKSGKKYIYFPFGGIISKYIIYNKLNNIMIDIDANSKKNYDDIAIHLDLFECNENISIFNEFLLSFLITKFYCYNEKVIYIPSNIEIYIQIPNCYNDFMNGHKILKFFLRDQDMIIKDNIPYLNLSKDQMKFFDIQLKLKNNEEIYQWLKNKIDISKFTYHQIYILINILNSLFNKYRRKITFTNSYKDITNETIDNIVKSTKYFTHGYFSKFLLNKEYLEKDKLNKELNDNEIFNEKLFFFTSSEFELLDISTEALKIRKEIDQLYFLDRLKRILDIKNPLKYDNNEKSLISLSDIFEKDNYIITIDNFRKMVLILYYIKANIPVILMGETGCGKRTLIKKLNQLLNNGEEKLIYININSINKEEKLINKIDDINDIAKATEKNGELWVYIDDLKECKLFHLITEIFIKRTYNGKEINNNIRFIAACSPFSIKFEDKKFDELSNDTDINSINALPQSLLFYVFNFGSLDKKIEDEYIFSIISEIISEKNLKEKIHYIICKFNYLLRIVFKRESFSAKYIKNFKKLCCFFIEYYKNKEKILSNKKGSEKSNKLKSIIISIYLCYYVRLSELNKIIFDSELNNFFKELIISKYDDYSQIIGKLDEDLINDFGKYDNIDNLDHFNFNQILLNEEDFILDNITLEKGIIKNRILKQNIFLSFISLVTHIPLIMIGKPGSSESLSVQLITKEMRGEYSTKKLFKLYPLIIPSYFQCNINTTYEDIEIYFENEKRKFDKLYNNCINNTPILMLLFDKLNLAEESTNHPLSCLYNILQNNEKISLVGISNRAINSSLMENALISQSPNFDNNLIDLTLYSKNIAQSINEDFINDEIFYKRLPNIYFKFRESLNFLKKLTVYKEYEMQEYKKIIDTYNKDEDFQKIFFCTEEEKKYVKIDEYDTFKKVKNKIKKFLNERHKMDNMFFDVEPFQNEKFKKLLYNDIKIKENIFDEKDFYYLVKGIALEMEESKYYDKNKILRKYIERNFGGFEFIIDFEKDYDNLVEFKNYNSDFYKNFLNKISERKKWSTDKIFVLVFNIYCSLNNINYYILDDDYKKPYNYMQNIIDNIHDEKSRFILLGIKSSYARLIHLILEKRLNKTIYFYEKSPFIEDDNNEFFINLVNKIKIHSKKGDIVILYNINKLIPILSNLFDKNYIAESNKYFSFINNGKDCELIYVNKAFKVIIMNSYKYYNE